MSLLWLVIDFCMQYIFVYQVRSIYLPSLEIGSDPVYYDGVDSEYKVQITLKKYWVNIIIFALANLVFPNAKVINMQEVYIPGDLLIVENITQDCVP